MKLLTVQFNVMRISLIVVTMPYCKRNDHNIFRGLSVLVTVVSQMVKTPPSLTWKVLRHISARDQQISEEFNLLATMQSNSIKRNTAKEYVLYITGMSIAHLDHEIELKEGSQ